MAAMSGLDATQDEIKRAMATIYQMSGRSWPFTEWIVESWLSLFKFAFLHANQGGRSAGK
jgi:hypothetical protein